MVVCGFPPLTFLCHLLNPPSHRHRHTTNWDAPSGTFTPGKLKVERKRRGNCKRTTDIDPSSIPRMMHWLFLRFFAIILLSSIHPKFALKFQLKSSAIADDDEEMAMTKIIRQRRQLEEPNISSQHQIDLNITVPFVFSARLYPFGPRNGDTELLKEVNEFRINSPLILLGENFDRIWIHQNGLVSLRPNFSSDPSLSIQQTAPFIAIFWTESIGPGRHVFIRETTDKNTLGLVQNEVNIQFRHGDEFKPESVVIISWTEEKKNNMDDDEDESRGTEQAAVDVLFQLALIFGENTSFIHAIFSNKLPSGPAIVGINGPPSLEKSEEESSEEEEEESNEKKQSQQRGFLFPGSGTTEASQVAEKSNIGIPGEWLIRLDAERLFLCGAGYQGLECVNSCLPSQWYMDCSRSCHCADGLACNVENGECPEGKCNPGWQGAPICNEDIDECTLDTTNCPNEQPDCMNTPGAFLCFCFEYDNSTGTCKGMPSISAEKESAEMALVERIPVPIASLSLIPQLGPSPNKKSLEGTRVGISHNEGNAVLPSHATTAIMPITILPLFHQSPFHFSSSTNLPRPIPTFSTTTFASPAADDECGQCSAANSVCFEGKCQCAIGWIGNGKECRDVDECHSNTTICGQNAECQNLMGTYQCICNIGFVASQNGQGCLDVDECSSNESDAADGPICPHENSLCVNTIGSFHCQCLPGFTGNPMAGSVCQDIDECQLTDYYCGKNANCTNLLGSFQCDCHPGFEPEQKLGGRCQDIDECSQSNKQQSPCHRAATCTNTEGGFQCECIEGFIGNGHQCHESVLFPVPTTESGTSFLSSTSSIRTPTPIQLDQPIVIFGHPFTSVFVSPLGLLSFGIPLNQSLDELITHPPPNLFIPLMANYDPKLGGSIETLQVDEEKNPPNWRGLISRATMLVQNDFGIVDFQAIRLIIVTFMERIALRNNAIDGKPNNFQAVLVQGRQASIQRSQQQDLMTFAIFLYNELQQFEQQKVQAGISHPTLGLHSIPVELLLSNSNVGQPGKWIFRVDHPAKVFACPSGTFGPPLCQQECNPGHWGLDCEEHCNCAQGLPCDYVSGSCADGKCAPGYTGHDCAQDIDECAIGTHRCHEHAFCTNTPGSYICKCKSLFYGDGFNCIRVDPCMVRFNAKCTENAHCDSVNEEMPECICNAGFYGDGRRHCQSNVLTSTISNSMINTTKTVNNKEDSNSSPSHLPSLPIQQWSSKTSVVTSTITTTKATFTTLGRIKDPILGREDGKETASMPSKTITDNDLLSAVADSNMLIAVICSILGSIWLIVALLFSLIYCFRKRRRESRNEYSPEMLGWSPTRTLNNGLTRTQQTSYFPIANKFTRA